jgi:hypothetical protein
LANFRGGSYFAPGTCACICNPPLSTAQATPLKKRVWVTEITSSPGFPWHLQRNGGTMESYDDLIELARICREQAREAKAKNVAAELRRMAKEYQKRAASLCSSPPPKRS